jgi:hypothetical protein
MRTLMLFGAGAVLASPAMAQPGSQMRVGAQRADTVLTRVTPRAALTAATVLSLKAEADEMSASNRLLEAQLQRERGEGDRRRIDELEDALARGTFALLQKRSQLAIGCMTLRSGFAGYLGVTFREEIPFEHEAGRIRLTLSSTPVVASVDAGSPAERAGVRGGDEWIAINARTLTDGVDFDEIDNPGATVEVRARREGRELQYRMVVAKKEVPEQACSGLSPVDYPLNLLAPGAPGTLPRAQVRPPASAPYRMQILVMPSRVGFGGAMLETLGDDAREFVEVQGNGVIVMDLAPGSPAAGAGLRRFDVIQQVNGKPVASVADFRAATIDQRVVVFSVMRKRTPLTVTLGGK